MNVKTRTLGFAILIGAASTYYFTDCCDAIAGFFIVFAYFLEAISKSIPIIKCPQNNPQLQIVAFAIFLYTVAFDGNYQSNSPFRETPIVYEIRMRRD